MTRKTSPKVCIYTAIYGGYDDLKEQPQQTLDCDFVCFTDNPALQTQPWEVVHCLNVAAQHPRLSAKYFKVMNHKLFGPVKRVWWPFGHQVGLRQYDYTIWIDGSVVIRQASFAEELIDHLGKYGLAMVVHPERDCIYDEAEACRVFPKYQGLPLDEQVAYYRSQGYPEHHGLMAAGLIVRDMRTSQLTKINEQWWHEIVTWTYQDQLSLPYVLWKSNYSYNPIHLNLWDNHLFGIASHYSDL